jgi:hypothetical protein
MPFYIHDSKGGKMKGEADKNGRLVSSVALMGKQMFFFGVLGQETVHGQGQGARPKVKQKNASLLPSS